jgi:hypothetical protein
MHVTKNDHKITKSNLNPNASDFVPSFGRLQTQSQPTHHDVFDINSYLDVEVCSINITLMII